MPMKKDNDFTSLYTPGNPKRNRKITREWFEKVLQKAFTSDEIVRKVRSLSDRDIVQLYRDWIPRETQVKLDQNVSISLNIEGFKPRQLQEPVEIQALPGDDSKDPD